MYAVRGSSLKLLTMPRLSYASWALFGRDAIDYTVDASDKAQAKHRCMCAIIPSAFSIWISLDELKLDFVIRRNRIAVFSINWVESRLVIRVAGWLQASYMSLPA